MSQLHDVLARARSPGEMVERKRFTLARGRALEKMREHALRSAEDYVLMLLQALVLGGAEAIAVDVSWGAVAVASVGGAVSAEGDVVDLMDFLFADPVDPATRHLHQLAVGVNALFALSPTLVRLESGDGTAAGTVRVDLDARGHGTVGTPVEGLAGTYIAAKLPRFAAAGEPPEVRRIEERCQHMPVPVLLNGRLPFGALGRRVFRPVGTAAWEALAEREGFVAGRPSRLSPSGLRIVVGGIWVCTVSEAALGGEHVHGVVCDDGLRRTADQGDVVRDERFWRMAAGVQPAVEAVLARSRAAVALPRIEHGPRAAVALMPPYRAATRAALAQALGGAVLHVVDPGDLDSVSASLDPASLQAPIAVVSELHLQDLAAHVDAPLRRLRGAVDVAVAADAWAREQRPVVAGEAGVEVVVVARPAAPASWLESTPVLRRRAGAPVVVEALDGPPLPGVMVRALGEATVSPALVWRLCAGVIAQGGGSAALTAALLGAVGSVWSVAAPPHARWVVPSWAEHLLALPLGPGVPSAAAVAALVGSELVVVVPDAAGLEAVGPIDVALGAGRFAVAGAPPVARVGTASGGELVAAAHLGPPPLGAEPLAPGVHFWGGRPEEAAVAALAEALESVGVGRGAPARVARAAHRRLRAAHGRDAPWPAEAPTANDALVALGSARAMAWEPAPPEGYRGPLEARPDGAASIELVGVRGWLAPAAGRGGVVVERGAGREVLAIGVDGVLVARSAAVLAAAMPVIRLHAARIAGGTALVRSRPRALASTPEASSAAVREVVARALALTVGEGIELSLVARRVRFGPPIAWLPRRDGRLELVVDTRHAGVRRALSGGGPAALALCVSVATVAAVALSRRGVAIDLAALHAAVVAIAGEGLSPAEHSAR